MAGRARGWSEREGGAAISVTASARNARRVWTRTAVALSRFGDWPFIKLLSPKAFVSPCFFLYPAALLS